MRKLLPLQVVSFALSSLFFFSAELIRFHLNKEKKTKTKTKNKKQKRNGTASQIYSFTNLETQVRVASSCVKELYHALHIVYSLGSTILIGFSNSSTF